MVSDPCFDESLDDSSQSVAVEVVYAAVNSQKLLSLTVQSGTTVQEAIRLSGILDLFPEINLTKQKVGIFSELVSLETPVQYGDRIEIYRPLLVDPKDARRKRDVNVKVKKARR